MTSNLRKDLCSVMRYAQIEEENKILISNGAQLDTWVVILNGLVEIEEADEVKVLQTGDWFVFFIIYFYNFTFTSLYLSKVKNLFFKLWCKTFTRQTT